MVSDQIYLNKWPLEYNLERLDSSWGLLNSWQVSKELQITSQQYKEKQKSMKKIPEGNDSRDTLSLMGRI